MGLLSNRYDTMSAINQNMMDNAFKWGQLSTPRYAGMAASAGLQGDMYGRSIGSMLGGQDPLMRKQDIIDEIMKKHPDPRTPAELNAVANDLQAAGLFDLAIKVREVSNETAIATSKVEKAAKPSKDLLDQITFGLTSQFITDQFVTDYMNEFHKDYMTGWAASDKKEGIYSPTSYNAKRAAAKKEIENQFKAYRNAISRDKSMGIDEISSLLANTTLLMEGFKEWSKKHSGHRASTWIDNHMVIGNAPTTETTSGLTSDGTNVQTDPETPAGAVGYGVGFTEEESTEQFNIDADRMMEGKTEDELRGMYDSLLQQSIGANGMPSPNNLNNANRLLFEKLMEKLGLDSMGNKLAASAFSGDTQQWFMDALGGANEMVA